MAKYARITLRRDSTLNWYAANPRLALGEVGVDMNLLRFKVGNGIDKWNELPYMNDDLYKDLDNATRELAEKIASILETVKNNKSDADKKISILDGRMTGLESRQSSYENNLTSQFAKVEKALNDGLSDFAETKKSLVARMDVIVGSATEDTEILDARVDALDVAHPNLGHNIRSLHNKILENETASNEKIKNLREELYSEFLSSDKDLQAEINKNSEAVLQNSLNIVQEADQRRKSIETETQARKSEDEYLQAKINDVNNVLASESLQRDETDKRLQSEINSNGVKISEVDKKIESEISERLQDSVGLAIQTESNAQANLQNNFNLLDEIQRRKQADDEIKSSLAVESREREKADKTLEQKIENEINERINSDVGLAQQAEANATANLENLFRIIYVEQKNKSLLELEASARFAGDYELQTQIDSTAEAGIQNAFNIHNEAEQRRKDLSAANERIDTLNSELEVEKQTRSEQDEKLNEGLQSEIKDREKQSNEILKKLDNEISEINTSVSGLAQQAENNAQANLQNVFNIRDEAERRKADLLTEEKTRIINDEALQEQINEVSQAGVQNSLNISQEAQERRKTNERVNTLESENNARKSEIEHEQLTREKQANEINKRIDDEVLSLIGNDAGLARQAEDNATANLENLFRIRDVEQKNKSLLELEASARFAGDYELQTQIDSTAEAGIQNALNIHNEAEQRRRDFSAANERIDTLNSEIEVEKQTRSEQDEKLNEGLQSEIKDREKQSNEILGKIDNEISEINTSVSGLAQQAESNANANIENTLNILEFDKKRKADLGREEATRIIEDESLQKQINTNSHAIFETVINLKYEAEQRRKVAERLIQEVKNREHEIENILYELQTLYKITLPGFDEDFHSLQVQENQNAEANIQNSLNILDEAQRREKLKSDIEKSINQEVQARNSEDLGLAKQINMLAFASNQNTLTLENINKQRKTDDEIERYIRIEQDDGLQLQINTLAQALFELILKENYTSKKIDAIEIAASEESTNFASDEVVNDLINDILNS